MVWEDDSIPPNRWGLPQETGRQRLKARHPEQLEHTNSVLSADAWVRRGKRGHQQASPIHPARPAVMPPHNTACRPIGMRGKTCTE